MRRNLGRRIIVVLLLGLNTPLITAQEVKRDQITDLPASVKYLMKLSLKDVIKEVPVASGIFFVGCPNCKGGAQEMNVFNWEPGMGDKIICKFCQMLFPNSEYPNNREKIIMAPGGPPQVYRYYESSEGNEHYFEAHAWYRRWQWIRNAADNLVQLWSINQDNAYGDRAATILGSFAQVFPDYAIRYDYPHRPVKFFPADQKWPYEKLDPYRGAKWYWWGYGDIPIKMATVYDKLKNSYNWSRMDSIIGPETEKRVINDLLRLGYEFTVANPETYTNMSPPVYSDMITLGRILNEPGMVHEGVERFNEFLKRGFFADGWWKEGTVSYHDQTVRGLKSVAKAAQGYTDPREWKGGRFENLDLLDTIPVFRKAVEVGNEAILPNGRKLPINDTWYYSKTESTEKTNSRIWPSLGNAALGVGTADDQVMVNINWSGNYGHAHYDNGSIILYAEGEELLSDIGYTHTKYRGWTLHTASHNTVVIDQKGQGIGTKKNPVTGRLLFYDDTDENVKTIDVDASPAYEEAKTYRRRLILVNVAPGFNYVVDRFDVEGGKTHDWFLHGMCEEEGTLETTIPLNKKMETLVPKWGGTKPPVNQYDVDLDGKKSHSYSYMRKIKKGSATNSWRMTWRYEKSGLRTHNIPLAETKVFSFKSPSIRKARENDNKLDDFMRNGIMLRQSGGTSTFLAVHEPFGEQPWIESVRAEGESMIISYKQDDKLIKDYIRIDDGGVTVESGSGWSYKSGSSVSGYIEEFEANEDTWKLQMDRSMPEISYVRLEMPNGSTLFCPVASVDGKWVSLKEDPGFTMEKNYINFHAFPNDRFEGPIRYTFFTVEKE